MKKDAQEVLASYVEGHLRLSHQRLQPDHKKETDTKHSLPPKSSKMLHLEHLDILNFSFKTNHKSAQFKDKVHNHE